MKKSLLIIFFALTTLCAYADAVVARQRPPGGRRLTPEQLETIEAVLGKNHKGGVANLSSSLRKLSTPLSSKASRVNASGSHMQGLGFAKKYNSTGMVDGWYMVDPDGDVHLKWVRTVSDDEDGDGMSFPITHGFIRNGHIYGFRSEVVLYWLISGHGIFTLDGEKIEYEEDNEFEEDLSECVLTCTYDQTDDTVYAYTLNSDGSSYMLQTINPENWEFNVVATQLTIEDVLMSMAYNPLDGEIYGITARGDFVKLGKTSGTITKVSSLPVSVSLANHGLTYNPVDRKFFCMYSNGDSNDDVVLYSIDPETFKAERIRTIDDITQFTIFVTPDGIPVDDAPRSPKINSVSFIDGSLSGSVTAVMPAEDFSGSALDGPLEFIVCVDGIQIAAVPALSGEEVTVDIPELEEGRRMFAFSVRISDKESPAIEKSMYVGYDFPLAPKNIIFEEGLARWDPVTKGVNDGYIDAENITYNVYIDDNRINSAPVRDTRYEFEMPGLDWRRCLVTVEADNKSHLSDKGFSNEIKCGNPIMLPYHITPTKTESSLCTTSCEPEYYIWEYSEIDEDNGVFYCDTYRSTPTDSWLILPPFKSNTSDKLVEVSFNMSTSDNEAFEENIEVLCSATGNLSDMMSVHVFEGIQAGNEPRRLTAYFKAPSEEKFFVAFKTVINEKGNYILLSDITVKESEKAVTVPSKVSGLVATPASRGAHAATLAFTLPVTDMEGNPLTLQTLDVTVTSSAETSTVTGVPGATCELDIATEQGFNNITVVVSNGEAGPEATVRVFTGIDIPSPLTAMTVIPSEDRRSMTLQWEAPETGINGGYVDPEKVTYNVVLLDEYYDWYVAEDLGTRKSYIYTPDNLSTPELVEVGILTCSEGGHCGTFLTGVSLLGKPYSLPLIEEFGYDVKYGPVVTDGDDRFYLYDDCLGTLSAASPYGTAAAIATLDEEKEKSVPKMMIPPVSTLGLSDIGFELPVYCSANTAPVTVWVESYGMPAEPVGTFFDNSSDGWTKKRFILPRKYDNREWIVISITSALDKEHPIAAFADYRIMNFYNSDFAVTAASAPQFVTIGEICHVTAEVENQGTETQYAPHIVCEVISEGRIVENVRLETDTETAMAELEKVTYAGEFIVGADAGENTELRFRITDKDENSNNDVITRIMTVSMGNQGVVNDLKASAEGESVVLNWTSPVIDNNRESFENYAPYYYGDRIGDFKTLQVDGYDCTGFNLDLPFWSEKKAWQVYSESELTPLIEESGYVNNYATASDGDKFIIAFCPWSVVVGDGFVADKWLISPEVKGGSIVSFDMYAYCMNDVVEILYSDGSDNPEDFKRVERIVSLTSEWRGYEYTLPENARYFAIRYIGDSDHSLFVELDNIRYEPTSAGKRISGYDIYRDGELIANNTSRAGSYVDEGAAMSDHTYYVVPVLDYNGTLTNGIKSNTASFSTSSVDDVTVAGRIIAGQGCVMINGYEGRQIIVSTPNGIIVAMVTNASGVETIPLPSGIYLIKVGDATSKIIVRGSSD